MTFSCSDYTDRVLESLMSKGLLKEGDFAEDDPQSQYNATNAVIERLVNLTGANELPIVSAFASGHAGTSNTSASCFFQELLVTHETLTEIGEVHGVHTLADCMYLLSAVQKGTHIDVPNDTESKIIAVIQAMPAATIWMTYIHSPAS